MSKRCEEIQTWFEQSLADNVSATKRVKIYFHLMICKCCKGYTKDSIRIDSTFKSLKNRNTRLTKEERARLTEGILK
ncbi:MAG: hypothetical protein ACPGU5_06785 [Lishizhenia sp.]